MNFTERWHTFFDRSAPNMILRFAVMFFGLALVAASVALTRASGLGTSPISCIPAVLSFTTAWTIGTWTFVVNVLFVLIQIILLRSDFNPIQFLQIAFVFVFSAMIDFFVPFCELIPMPNYGFELFYTILGVFMTGFGIFLQVKASLITLPGEGIVLAVSKVTKIAFPKCKVAFDTSQGVIGVIISLIAMGGLFGVREGTILSALFVGVVVNFCNKPFRSLGTGRSPQPLSSRPQVQARPKKSPLPMRLPKQHSKQQTFLTLLNVTSTNCSRSTRLATKKPLPSTSYLANHLLLFL